MGELGFTFDENEKLDPVNRRDFVGFGRSTPPPTEQMGTADGTEPVQEATKAVTASGTASAAINSVTAAAEGSASTNAVSNIPVGSPKIGHAEKEVASSLLGLRTDSTAPTTQGDECKATDDDNGSGNGLSPTTCAEKHDCKMKGCPANSASRCLCCFHNIHGNCGLAVRADSIKRKGSSRNTAVCTPCYVKDPNTWESELYDPKQGEQALNAYSLSQPKAKVSNGDDDNVSSSESSSKTSSTSSSASSTNRLNNKKTRTQQAKKALAGGTCSNKYKRTLALKRQKENEKKRERRGRKPRWLRRKPPITSG
jgi:hypothetical protein